MAGAGRALKCILRYTLITSLAGTGGALINVAGAVLLLGTDKIMLALMPGRYAVAIALAAVLPVLFHHLKGAAFWLAGLVLLTLGASLLAKLVFGAEAPWHLVLTLNAIYAAGTVFLFLGLTRDTTSCDGH
jgi:hypothetical protein